MSSLSRHRHARGGRGSARTTVLLVTVLAGVVAAAGIAIGVTLTSGKGSPGDTSTGTGGLCEHLTVPAYFAPGYWDEATRSTPPPADMILDINGIGAGTAPVPQFQALVNNAKAAGITVLGYSSTVDGQRPIAQVEADVRHYAAWYGVTSIFLDRVSGQPPQIQYYQQLADYIHQTDPGSQVWLNPGDFPDQRYMSIGDVVMVFEGTYLGYLALDMPSWVRDYPASKFAQNIYSTPEADLANALKLAGSRDAGYVYVTDGSGLNPYNALPSYWSSEDTSATAACQKG